VLKPTAVVELVWQDETGSTAVTTINCLSSATVDEIDADITMLASILVPLTDASLVGQRIRYKVVSDTPVVASGGTSIKRTGVFFFSTDDELPLAVVTVPAVKDSVLAEVGPGAGIIIELGDSDVISFTEAVIDNGISNVFADDITGILTAYLQSRV
jgi:hypothetical protein